MSENRKRKFKEDHVSLEKVCTTKAVNTKVPTLSNAKVRKLEPILGNSRTVDGNQSYVITDDKHPYITTTNNSGEKLGQEQHLFVVENSSHGLIGVHYEGPATRNEDGTFTCNSGTFRECSNSLARLSMPPSSSSAKKDDDREMEYDNCGQRFKESIEKLIKAVAKNDKREKVKDIFKQFWKIFSMALSISFLHSSPDFVLKYYDTKVNELLEAAYELHQSLKYPPLSRKKPGDFDQEESVALQVDWYTFLRKLIRHLHQATNNKCKVEELEKDLREELGVLKGLDAEFWYPEIIFSKEQEKQDNLCKMQQAALAFFNIDDPSKFEDLLQDIWKNQEPYIKSLEDEIDEMKDIQKEIRFHQRK